MDLMSFTAVELGKKIASGEVSALEATQAAISRIERLESDYNCFVTVDKEGALAQAEIIQKKISKAIP